MSTKTIQVEFDDFDAIYDYTYEAPRAESLYEPGCPHGAVHTERLVLRLAGADGKPVEIDVTSKADELRITAGIREQAYAEERMEDAA